tara:strand:- start:1427 stop:1840 length:414 start_codon:yes stop_codon:yes gene_type:complete
MPDNENTKQSTTQFIAVSKGYNYKKTILICCPLICLWSSIIFIIGISAGASGGYVILSKLTTPTMNPPVSPSFSPTMAPTISPTADYERYEPGYERVIIESNNTTENVLNLITSEGMNTKYNILTCILFGLGLIMNI